MEKKFEFKFKHVGIAVIGQYCSKRILNPAAEKLLKGILINWASVVFGPFYRYLSLPKCSKSLIEWALFNF